MYYNKRIQYHSSITQISIIAVEWEWGSRHSETPLSLNVASATATCKRKNKILVNSPKKPRYHIPTSSYAAPLLIIISVAVVVLGHSSFFFIDHQSSFIIARIFVLWRGALIETKVNKRQSRYELNFKYFAAHTLLRAACRAASNKCVWHRWCLLLNRRRRESNYILRWRTDTLFDKHKLPIIILQTSVNLRTPRRSPLHTQTPLEPTSSVEPAHSHRRHRADTPGTNEESASRQAWLHQLSNEGVHWQVWNQVLMVPTKVCDNLCGLSLKLQQRRLLAISRLDTIRVGRAWMLQSPENIHQRLQPRIRWWSPSPCFSVAPIPSVDQAMHAVIPYNINILHWQLLTCNSSSDHLQANYAHFRNLQSLPLRMTSALQAQLKK